MFGTVNFYSNEENEIQRFLNSFFEKNIVMENKLFWQKKYSNPINMIEIISTFVDNSEKFNITLWISIDTNVFININEYTINSVIKYLIERYPA